MKQKNDELENTIVYINACILFLKTKKSMLLCKLLLQLRTSDKPLTLVLIPSNRWKALNSKSHYLQWKQLISLKYPV